MLSLIYDSLEEYSDVKAAGAVKAAKKSASTAFIQNNRLLYVTACITKLLADNNVKSVVLKGVSAARYYPSPFLRKSGDIDILAGDGENFECARRLIKGYGYIEKSISIHSIMRSSYRMRESQLSFTGCLRNHLIIRT